MNDKTTEGFVIRVGGDSYGFALYIVDEDEHRVAHFGNHLNPGNDDLATFDTRTEAEDVYERICESDRLAAQLGGVVPLAEAEAAYRETA